MKNNDSQYAFLSQIDGTRGIGELFDYIPDISLFVKNKHSEFVQANPAFCAMLGLKDQNELIGKTDLDFFVRDVGQKYIDEDREVMASGRPFVNRIWLVPNSNGTLVWYLCTKIPLFDDGGEVVGVAGILRDYSRAGAVLEPYQEMAGVIEHIFGHYAEAISVKTLAEMVSLSVSQFDRRFRKLFHLSPVKYINKVRIHMACQRLSESDLSITQIALDTGFYDHSYFTKKFKEEIGMTPRQYRKGHYLSV